MFLITNDVKKMQEQEEQIVVQCFLAGLGPKYEVARTQLLTNEALPSLSDIYAHLLRACKDDEKEQRAVLNETIALVGTNPKSNNSYNKKGEGGVSRDKIFSGGSRGCYYCGEQGHVRKNCWKLNGKPASCPNSPSLLLLDSSIKLSCPANILSWRSCRLAGKVDFAGVSKSHKFFVPIQHSRLFLAFDSSDGHPCFTVSEDDKIKKSLPNHEPETLLSKWSPPRYLWRGLSVLILAGQVIVRTLKGKVHWKNTLQQLERVGPKSVGVCLLTSAFVGMAFTIQFVREFTRLGLNRSVGGVLALAFSRELSPVITAIVVAGRIGSAFAAELGTMQVSEQTDTLIVLGANPVDYLVTPRVIASCVALPLLTLICFTVGMASSALLSDAVYGISINIILDSAQRALRSWDIISAMIKSQVFGAIISVVSCAWGVTTLGGAKGVGESTTSAVVISLVGIFIADFALSCCFFQGAGDSLKNCM
ncbi:TRIGALACTOSYLDIACYLGLYCEROL 1, chloroplastic [Olea europaea subsp. europaea]|uniref:TRIGALACTOSYLDIACYLGLYCEROL 1, chloroplastic n=1 Tax=Olea europaea subsp. europaea TaxID=158383 RepID=A0A8S0RR83_OLEEU|nr:TRIGALACTOSYLDIACYLGLYCEROL 1, chloroplastic [Olea europaea subsp. europaea]